MPDPMLLLILVLALATGLVAAMVVSAHMQATDNRFYRSLLTNILLFNLLVLSGMALAILGQASTPKLALATPFALVLMAALKLGWLLAFVRTLAELLGERGFSPTPRGKWIGFLALAIYGLCVAMGWAGSLDRVANVAVVTFEFLIIGGALFAALSAVLRANRSPRNNRRTINLQFASFHAFLMVLILLSLLDGFFWGVVSPATRTLTNGVLLLLFNAFPIAWIRRYRPPENAGMADRFDRYGVTPRERQTVELIRQGRTNQEIADHLFISVATVKDHNNRIFRKCGVRNRTELAALFRGEQAPAA